MMSFESARHCPSQFPVPEPWAEVSKIPWDDPAFSARMLQEHLTQDHDAASRRTEIISHQIHWIHEVLLEAKTVQQSSISVAVRASTAMNSRASGTRARGIDFAPASIDHARETAASEGLDCDLQLGDLQTTPSAVISI